MANKRQAEELSEIEPEFSYRPHHAFMRCHSHNDNPADGQTKVWRCAFEPDPANPSEWTGIVATCGGAYVCLINAQTGKCETKLKQSEDQYFDVSWTTVSIDGDGKPTNILISAGFQGIITLMHPEKLRCFAHFQVFSTYISCLRIHPQKADWIYCGAELGKINLVDMGLSNMSNYKPSFQIIQKLRCPGTDIIQIAVNENLLIGAAQKGCFIWQTSPTVTPTATVQNHDYQVAFPGTTGSHFCDGVTLLDDNTAAIKFNKSQSIFIWSLDRFRKAKKPKTSQTITVTPDLIMPWVKTNEIYIDITSRNGMLVAGDPWGNVILYSLSEYLSNKNGYGDTATRECILCWPGCMPDSSSSKSLRLDNISKPPLINHASLSPDMQYLVACTDNNLVCIWKKQES